MGSNIVYGYAISRLLDECFSIFGTTSSNLMVDVLCSISSMPSVSAPFAFWFDVSRKCTSVASEY